MAGFLPDTSCMVAALCVQPGKALTLGGRAYRVLLRSAPERGIVGGRVYDAVIIECAIRGTATAFLTFNERDFAPLAPPGLHIVVPRRTGAG